MKKRFFAAAMIVAVSSASAAPVDLVTDGGFESGTSAAFSSDFTEVAVNTGTDQLLITTGLNGVAPKTGTYFMFVNGGNDPTVDPTVWSQSVSVTSGTEYTLSFSMADWSGTSPDANLSIRVGGIEILNATSSAQQDIWEDFSANWISTLSGAQSLSFVELSTGFGGNDYTLDDIALTFNDSSATPMPIPLPAALPLLLAGLGALAVLRRRS